MVKPRQRTTARAASKPRGTRPREGRPAKQPDGDALATYKQKRDFDVTPEPAPESSPARAKKVKKKATPRSAPVALAFVVQKHDATRLHYDVRIEIAGAMMSWAVPKGPSFDPSIKRLAVETEDHPMAYNLFEGRIPDGEYGAGDVLIWDRGTYETVPPGQEEAMRAKGHFVVRFFGEKLAGDWHFIRTGGRADRGAAGGEPVKAQWLMFKAKDRHADATRDIVTERPESLVSGKTATRGPRRVNASDQGKSADKLLAAVGEVALATLTTSVADPSAYLYEIKYDGYRLLAAKAGREVRLVTRKRNDWTARFPLIASALSRLPVREAVIDGEACIIDDAGRPSFEKLQQWLAGEKTEGKLAYAAFDLLWVDGRDLRAAPIEERRDLLEPLMRDAESPLSLSAAIGGELADIARVAKASGLEGLVAKRKGSAYVGGRSMQWLKLKFVKRQECAIVGYLPLKGAPAALGALLIGVVEDGVLRFAGRAGTGFDDRTRKDLAKRLDADRVPIAEVARAPVLKEARWVTPKLVCEIAFTEWTREGVARHPSFVALREDKSPSECALEVPLQSATSNGTVRSEAKYSDVHEHGRRPRAVTPTPTATTTSKSRATAKLSNPDKVLFPKNGYTKRDIADYYRAVAPVMLPHLEGRPLTLQRYPHGIHGEEWYQQNAPDKCPDFVRLLRIENKHRIVAENVATLEWLANLAALTIHQWASHAPKSATTDVAIARALAQPDYVVIDLDPGDGTWAHLIEAAEAVRALLDALHFESAVKTSGKRGIHIVVPIVRGPSHQEATAFAEQMATAVAKVLPKIATVERMKAKRGGRLYVDFLQNGEGKTVVAPYTIRALDGAPVSTPITWGEVTTKLDPSRFTIKTVLRRIHKHGDLFASALSGANKLP